MDFSSAISLAHAIRNKQISPVEVVKSTLNRLNQIDGLINSIIWRRDEAVLADAKRAEQAVMRGDDLPVFHGVPIPIKDLTEAVDQPWTSGSRACLGRKSITDALIVKKMREAGFLFIGRSNSPEFGTLPTTENLAFGATRNPWNTEHTPGGSSGGAAAAVSAELVTIAHASDGGGSIRIPAACTGLVGLKPSRGRIPRGPLVSDVLHGFPQDGCITRNITDTAFFLDAVSHNAPGSWHNAPLPMRPFAKALHEQRPRLRIGFTAEGPVPARPALHIVEALTKTAQLLASLGHDVYPMTPAVWHEDPQTVGDDFITLWTSGIVYAHGIDTFLLEPHNQKLLERSQQLSTHAYIKALVRLQIFSARCLECWERDFDLLLTPSLAMDPPKIGWLTSNETTDPVSFLWQATEMVPYNSWCNVSGQPAISLPVGFAPSGLPIGVQLVAAPWREDILLQIGLELEKALDWPSWNTPKQKGQ